MYFSPSFQSHQLIIHHVSFLFPSEIVFFFLLKIISIQLLPLIRWDYQKFSSSWVAQRYGLVRNEVSEEAPAVFVSHWLFRASHSQACLIDSEGSLMPCWAAVGGTAVARAPRTSVWVQPLPCPTKPCPSDVCHPQPLPGHSQPGNVGPQGTRDTHTSSLLLMLRTLLVLTSTF